MASMLEQKWEKTRFVRVDSDVTERLIAKSDDKKVELNDQEKDTLTEVFRSQLPKMEKVEFNVEVQSLGDDSAPAVITQSEYMRRMKDMSRYQSGMGFYAQMPDMYSVVLNSNHRLVKDVLDNCNENTKEALAPVLSEIKGQEARLAAIKQQQKDKKPEDITQEEKDDKSNTEKAIDEEKAKRRQIIADYAKGNDIVRQILDLALLQNGMLRGAALDEFIKRSAKLIG